MKFPRATLTWYTFKPSALSLPRLSHLGDRLVKEIKFVHRSKPEILEHYMYPWPLDSTLAIEIILEEEARTSAHHPNIITLKLHQNLERRFTLRDKACIIPRKGKVVIFVALECPRHPHLDEHILDLFAQVCDAMGFDFQDSFDPPLVCSYTFVLGDGKWRHYGEHLAWLKERAAV